MRVILMSVLWLAFIAAPLNAHQGVKRDGNDVSGPLDIRRVEIRHHDGRLFYRIEMYQSFRCRVLRGSNSWVWVDLDSRGDRRMDYFAEVKCRHGELRTRVYRIVDRPDTDVDGRRRVGKGYTRHDEETIFTSFRRRLIHSRPGYVRWRIVAFRNNSWDEAPNGGRMPRHSF
jgi:hypothetical protein